MSVSAIVSVVAAGAGALIQEAIRQGASVDELWDAFVAEPTIPIGLTERVHEEIQQKLPGTESGGE